MKSRGRLRVSGRIKEYEIFLIKKVRLSDSISGSFLFFAGLGRLCLIGEKMMSQKVYFWAHFIYRQNSHKFNAILQKNHGKVNSFFVQFVYVNNPKFNNKKVYFLAERL